MSDKNLKQRADNLAAIFNPDDPRDLGKIEEFKKLGKDIQTALRKSEVSESRPVKMFRDWLYAKVEQERVIRQVRRKPGEDKLQWIENQEKSWQREELYLELCRWWSVDLTRYERRIKE